MIAEILVLHVLIKVLYYDKEEKTNREVKGEVSDMKAIYKILKGIEYNRAEQRDFIMENYKRRAEDVSMPWEKYLIKDNAVKSDEQSA